MFLDSVNKFSMLFASKNVIDDFLRLLSRIPANNVDTCMHIFIIIDYG